jgi:NADH/NAD ratio-sensing transcriptional regulator Rex
MKARIVHLGKLGKRLEGPAIGKLLAKFLNNCKKENFVAVIDCKGVERIGEAVIKNAKLFSDKKPEIYIADAKEEVVATIMQILK